MPGLRNTPRMDHVPFFCEKSDSATNRPFTSTELVLIALAVPSRLITGMLMRPKPLTTGRLLLMANCCGICGSLLLLG